MTYGVQTLNVPFRRVQNDRFFWSAKGERPLLDGLRWNERVIVCSPSGFVLRLSAVHALCNLASAVLKLLRLDEICVPLLSFLVHVIRDLALPHDVLQHRLAFVETCPRAFLS